MNDLFAILVLVSFLGIIISIFKPSFALFWNKNNATRKKSLLIYSIVLLASFILFGVTDDSINQNEKSKTDKSSALSEMVNGEKAKRFVPDILNVNILKESFSNPPFSFKYWELSTFNDTNHTYTGYKNESAKHDHIKDNITIQFDPTTSEIYYAGLYCETDNVDITIENAKKISDFAGYFDKQAVDYLRDNFNNIYLNEKTYSDSSEFQFDDKILFTVTHDFITAKQIIKREGKNAITNPLNFTVEIENMNKKISLR